MSRINANDSSSDEEDMFLNPHAYEIIVISSDSEDDDSEQVIVISSDESLPFSGNSLPSSDDSEIEEVNFHPEDDFFGAWAGEIMANAPPSHFPYAQPFDTPPAPANSPVQPLGRLRVRTYDTAFPNPQPTTPTGRAQPPSARRAIDFSEAGPSTSSGTTAAALAFLQPPPQLLRQNAMPTAGPSTSSGTTAAALAFLQPPPKLIRQNAMPTQATTSSHTQRLCSREATQPMFDGGNLRHKPSVSVDSIFLGLRPGNIIPFFGRAANKTVGPIPSRPQNYDCTIPTPRFPFPP